MLILKNVVIPICIDICKKNAISSSILVLLQIFIYNDKLVKPEFMVIFNTCTYAFFHF